MRLICLGINHRTASLEVREKLSFGKREIAPALAALGRLKRVREAVLLSTCNRVEIYAAGPDASGLKRDLLSFMRRAGRLRGTALAKAAYCRRDRDAIRHLMTVAAGLDSQVLGEPQILSQVREAFAEAMRGKATGTVLNGVFNRALAVAKRVRHETEIGRLPASVSSVAVELAERVFGDFTGKGVLLLGTGETSELVAEHLVARGRPRLLVAGERHLGRARRLAARHGGKALVLASAQARLAEADIVIVATASRDYVLTARDVARALAARNSQGMFLIDLSVPRNIEPAAGELEDAYLYNLDDLKAAAAENLKRRAEWLPAAREIVEEALAETNAWLGSLETVPVIVALQEFGERCRRDVWERASGSVRQMPEELRAEVEYLMRALVAKLLHSPISQVKRAHAEGSSAALIGALKRLFRLD